MATDLEWKEKEEEISSEGDGESCGLDTKRRRGAKVSQQTPAMEGENADSIVADATATAREDDRNVYWDADLGSGHSTGGTLRKSTETCHLFSEENLQNGKAVTKLDNIQICGDVENKQHQNHIKKGNELHLHIAPEIIGKVDISVSKPEIQGYEQNNIVKNINATELDLEKIIEEQETHDLFCPNCHSCITKRVILRKRKRRVQDIQHEERPEKLREIEPDDVANSADTGETIHDHGPDVFRCLSCFSFFIPTDNGFNIFRIFGKKEVTVNLQEPSMAHSRLTSDGDANWFFSIFKPESSKNKRNKEASLQAKLNVSSSEDKKLDCNQSTAVLAVSEATQVGENDAPAFIEKINSSSLCN
ncbi:hypothetical protein AXF42_Ash017805 [Apostasia shenzhenica]|uniref:Uncharacterized protein n=1 Tax=Apostasia shenzhenica TaxID=1088818 RepID=A0A2I0A3T5_9ASPA|nr:hypothetical protein AXF42_Ash017805 [Apostasia shenzhenica]